jgi:hypothetical protein
MSIVEAVEPTSIFVMQADFDPVYGWHPTYKPACSRALGKYAPHSHWSRLALEQIYQVTLLLKAVISEVAERVARIIWKRIRKHRSDWFGRVRPMIKEARCQNWPTEDSTQWVCQFPIYYSRSRFLQVVQLGQVEVQPALPPQPPSPKPFVSRRPPQTGNADSINEIKAIRTRWRDGSTFELSILHPPENVDDSARTWNTEVAMPIKRSR